MWLLTTSAPPAGRFSSPRIRNRYSTRPRPRKQSTIRCSGDSHTETTATTAAAAASVASCIESDQCSPATIR